MNYTQIRRGPMGGDHYTQIHNGVFRDRRLSPKAKGVFGYISTHTDGWSTSAERIAEEMNVGITAIRGALDELKRYHYLVRGRERKPDGRLGESWMFLTDLPAQLAEFGITDDTEVVRRVASAMSAWRADVQCLQLAHVA